MQTIAALLSWQHGSARRRICGTWSSSWPPHKKSLAWVPAGPRLGGAERAGQPSRTSNSLNTLDVFGADA